MLAMLIPVSATARQPVAVFTSEACLSHRPGPAFLNPEQPERLETLLNAMRGPWRQAFGEAMQTFEPAADVSEEELLRVHTQAHVDQCAAAFDKSKSWPLPVNAAPDVVVSRGTEAAAVRAAGLVVAAVDTVFGGGAGTTAADDESPQRAFVMSRPPGHHAEANRPMGFCCYNNVMVGVAHAQAVHGVGKIAILDFDVHHGNGDADIALSNPSLLYASSHQSPCFPGTGTTAGREGPHSNVVNAPLPPGAGSPEFKGAWATFLLPAVEAFEPEALFLSAGFDAHAEDAVASMALADDDFEWITAEVCRRFPGRPIVSVLEGGYNVAALERSCKAHIKGLIEA